MRWTCRLLQWHLRLYFSWQWDAHSRFSSIPYLEKAEVEMMCMVWLTFVVNVFQHSCLGIADCTLFSMLNLSNCAPNNSWYWETISHERQSTRASRFVSLSQSNRNILSLRLITSFFFPPNKQGWIGVLILSQNKNRPTLSKGKTPGLYLRMILACYFCTFTNADKSYGETGGAFVVDYFVTSLRI